MVNFIYFVLISYFSHVTHLSGLITKIIIRRYLFLLIIIVHQIYVVLTQLIKHNPSINIFPLFLLSSLVIHLNVVVLPAPLTPNKPKHSPYSKQNDIFLTAGVISSQHEHTQHLQQLNRLQHKQQHVPQHPLLV